MDPECSAQPELQFQPDIRVDMENKPFGTQFDPTAWELAVPQPEEKCLQIPEEEQGVLHQQLQNKTPLLSPVLF